MQSTKFLAAAFSISVLQACNSVPSVGAFNSEPRDWEFIQSVGGIALGEPYSRQGITWLPVELDVSGNQRITVEPSVTNTGLECVQLVSRRKQNSLYIVIYTLESSRVPSSARRSLLCDAIPLTGLVSTWGFMTQNIYYGFGDDRELIGSFNPASL